MPPKKKGAGTRDNERQLAARSQCDESPEVSACSRRHDDVAFMCLWTAFVFFISCLFKKSRAALTVSVCLRPPNEDVARKQALVKAFAFERPLDAPPPFVPTRDGPIPKLQRDESSAWGAAWGQHGSGPGGGNQGGNQGGNPGGGGVAWLESDSSNDSDDPNAAQRARAMDKKREAEQVLFGANARPKKKGHCAHGFVVACAFISPLNYVCLVSRCVWRPSLRCLAARSSGEHSSEEGRVGSEAPVARRKVPAAAGRKGQSAAAAAAKRAQKKSAERARCGKYMPPTRCLFLKHARAHTAVTFRQGMFAVCQYS